MPPKEIVKKSKFRKNTEIVITAVLLAVLFRTFVAQAYKIPSGSMIPTLLVGDQIFVNKFIYGMKVPFTDGRLMPVSTPERGDVIVFSFPKNRGKEECRSLSGNISYRIEHAWSSSNPIELFKDDCRDFIKRVIGIGGDKIEVKDKTVYVNNVPLDESYIIHDDPYVEGAPRDNFGPFIVPHGSVFVMGDNRDRSYDSRFWGVVNTDEIKGKAFIKYWSWDSKGSLLNKTRWNRIGKLIH